jgi:ABC-type branched-subunit amino acid transport system substrate-binding protein
MLSTRFSFGQAARAAVLAFGALALAACQVAPTTQVSGPPGPAVDLSQPVRVALLVPTGGGDPGGEEIGRSIVNAARLAQADAQGVNLDLNIYETGGTANGGAAAARRAIEEGAQIVLGPVFSPETAGAGAITRSAGLSMLSFNNNPDNAEAGVYLIGLTFNNAADRVVSYAVSRGLRNIAVVYPEGIQGETARRAVSSAAQRTGASLVAQQGYELSVQGIERASGPIANNLRSGGANAVVLADVPTGGLGYIGDGLRAQGITPLQAQFLGIHRWELSPEVLNQPSLQGAWFAAPDAAAVSAFEGRYRNAYGQRPHELAALGYDGVAAVAALVRRAQAQGGRVSPFAPANLMAAEGFDGVYGAFRLLPNGLSERNLAVREVRDGTAPVIDRAPRAFVGLVN